MNANKVVVYMKVPSKQNDISLKYTLLDRKLT